ncbi:MAG: ParA family protein [Acidiferrobacterales bacterium]
MARAQRVVRSTLAQTNLRCPVLTIAQQKGGVGKTTWARVLAEYFSLVREVRVLLIDTDPQCNLSQRFLKMERDPLVEDGVLPPIHPDYDSATETEWDGRSHIANVFLGLPLVPYGTHLPKVDILPGHATFLQEVVKKTPAELKERVTNRLKEFLRSGEVQEAYDIIIIDTPPSRNPLTQAALRASSHVLMPMELEVQSLEGLVHMLSFWRSEQRLRTKDDPLRLVGVLPNKYRRVALHQGILEAMRKDPVLSAHILPFEVGLRVAFSESDHAEARPKTVLQLPAHDEARREAELVCRYIEGEVFGNVTE